jgi:hypothetical protein
MKPNRNYHNIRSYSTKAPPKYVKLVVNEEKNYTSSITEPQHGRCKIPNACDQIVEIMLAERELEIKEGFHYITNCSDEEFANEWFTPNPGDEELITNVTKTRPPSNELHPSNPGDEELMTKVAKNHPPSNELHPSMDVLEEKLVILFTKNISRLEELHFKFYKIDDIVKSPAKMYKKKMVDYEKREKRSIDPYNTYSKYNIRVNGPYYNLMDKFKKYNEKNYILFNNQLSEMLACQSILDGLKEITLQIINKSPSDKHDHNSNDVNLFYGLSTDNVKPDVVKPDMILEYIKLLSMLLLIDDWVNIFVLEDKIHYIFNIIFNFILCPDRFKTYLHLHVYADQHHGIKRIIEFLDRYRELYEYWVLTEVSDMLLDVIQKSLPKSTYSIRKGYTLCSTPEDILNWKDCLIPQNSERYNNYKRKQEMYWNYMKSIVENIMSCKTKDVTTKLLLDDLKSEIEKWANI